MDEATIDEVLARTERAIATVSAAMPIRRASVASGG
jgi:hypothetical protein